MKNEFYFTIRVSKEQIAEAMKLVQYSLEHHPVRNIWDARKKDETKKLRTIGTIGEVVFADVYCLPRPTRSFGAIDGQDFGKDFELTIRGEAYVFDVKTMHRKSNIFYDNYVLNIPARNIWRKDSKTANYFCISLHKEGKELFASFLGYLSKQDIVEKKIGILYTKNTKRIRADRSSFIFYEDTYEVFFENIVSPFVSSRIKRLDGYVESKLNRLSGRSI